MTEVAFRACPHCGTHNRYYMLVCTKCGQSLEAVALVGTPPPGFVVARRSRAGRLVLGLLVLAAAAALALLLSRLLRVASLEPEAAASTVAVGEEAPARPTTDRSPTWKTLEQRMHEAGPPTVHPPTAPPTTAAPAPPVSVPPAPPPAAPAPPRRRTAFRQAPGEERDPASLREVRRAALHRAKEHLRALEQRRDELRDERDDESSTSPTRRDALRIELARVQRQLAQADRQMIRAEWALREVEQ
jgi:hypothetical protein